MTQQEANNTDELIFIATSDIAARTKGRSMRLADFNENTSIGWVPANLGIGPLGHIVDNIPFGSSGDLRLLPDHDAVYRIDGVPDKPAFTVALPTSLKLTARPGKPVHAPSCATLCKSCATTTASPAAPPLNTSSSI